MERPAFAGVDQPIDVVEIRSRIRAMSDEQLRKYGRAARYMASAAAYGPGQKPRETFVIQLEEARAEWKRRKILIENSR